MVTGGSDGGFTGLEAAIVLIAFGVVASVFSYVVIGSGFFATQKSQEVIHSGLQQVSSTLMLAGSVYGVGTPGGTIDTVNFSLTVTAGGTPIDMEKVVITYHDADHLETLTPVPGYFSSSTTPGTWAVTVRENNAGAENNLLEKGEQFTISVHPVTGIAKNTEFAIEVKPSGGATLEIRRTAPSAIYPVNLLY